MSRKSLIPVLLIQEDEVYDVGWWRGVREVTDEVRQLALRVRRIAQDVYDELGPGHDESVYRLAMAVDLRAAEIPYRQELSADIHYKGHWVGRREIDFVIDNTIAVELKCVKAALPGHKNQALAQGGALGIPSMLINYRNLRKPDGEMALEPTTNGVEVWIEQEPLPVAADA